MKTIVMIITTAIVHVEVCYCLCFIEVCFISIAYATPHNVPLLPKTVDK